MLTWPFTLQALIILNVNMAVHASSVNYIDLKFDDTPKQQR